jgi:hypothetical protein
MDRFPNGGPIDYDPRITGSTCPLLFALLRQKQHTAVFSRGHGYGTVVPAADCEYFIWVTRMRSAALHNTA